MLTDSKGNIITSSKGGLLFRVAQEPPPPPPPPSLILDQVTGAIHAYSNARKLIDSYTGALIRVRRSNDNTESDIGVSGNELDQSALTSFTGANNGFIRTKYCQLTGRNLAQTSNANQPQIVVSGSVVAVSGKPYAQYDGSDDFMLTGSATPVLDDDSTVFVVFESQSGTTLEGVFEELRGDLTPTNERVVVFTDTRATLFRLSNYQPDGTARFVSFGSQQPTSTKRILALKITGNLVEGFAEGAKIGDITSSASFSVNTAFFLGRLLNGSVFFSGKIAELLIWNRALTSGEMTTVTNNIKSFYSIT
jgi:hypothetical protein